jgi:hypothetical protein
VGSATSAFGAVTNLATSEIHQINPETSGASMNRSHLSALVALAFLAPLSMSAQSNSDSQTTEPPKWAFSLGVDPTALDLRTKDPGVEAQLIANLTRNWQTPGSRWSRQLSLMGGGCVGCSSRIGKQYLGLTAGTSLDLFSLSRFTPYVHTGAGLYYTHLNGNAPSSAFLQYGNAVRNNIAFGVNGGLGIKARIGSHEFFIDQTLHAFDVRAIDRGVYPLSFGFRF